MCVCVCVGGCVGMCGLFVNMRFYVKVCACAYLCESVCVCVYDYYGRVMVGLEQDPTVYAIIR